VALGLLYTVWGSTYLAIRYAVQTLPPFLLSSVRFLTAGALLYGWLRYRGAPTPSRQHWVSGFIIGALLLGGGNGPVVWAEKTIPSGLAALMVSVVPLWMGFFDWIRPHGQRPRVQTAVGLVMGFVGLIILIGPENLQSPTSLSPGLIVLLFAPITWALGSVYSRRAALPSSPFMSTAIEMIAGGFVLLLLGAGLGEFQQINVPAISWVSIAALIYLIFIGALVGFSAYIYLLKHASLSVASTYAYVNPVVAVILGWLVASEKITVSTFIGGAIIVASVALMTMSPSERRCEDEVPPSEIG
jgi:drug/metabolite transporter (DMT)-like permease